MLQRIVKILLCPGACHSGVLLQTVEGRSINVGLDRGDELASNVAEECGALGGALLLDKGDAALKMLITRVTTLVLKGIFFAPRATKTMNIVHCTIGLSITLDGQYELVDIAPSGCVVINWR